jgi:hypothetical protein
MASSDMQGSKEKGVGRAMTSRVVDREWVVGQAETVRLPTLLRNEGSLEAIKLWLTSQTDPWPGELVIAWFVAGRTRGSRA